MRKHEPSGINPPPLFGKINNKGQMGKRGLYPGHKQEKIREKNKIIKRLWEEANPKWNQATKIIKKCGGVRNVAVIAGVPPDTVLDWLSPEQKPNEQYTDGLIPIHHLLSILSYSRFFGILLTVDDLYPDFTKSRDEALSLGSLTDEQWEHMKKWIDRHHDSLE